MPLNSFCEPEQIVELCKLLVNNHEIFQSETLLWMVIIYNQKKNILISRMSGFR